MMFSVITIFPDLITNYAKYGLLNKAIENNLIKIEIHDLREFADNKHKKVDDRPFGGGAGMVLMPQPLFSCIEHVKNENNGRVILMSAYANKLNQKRVKELSDEDHLILVCGRYEGVDQRVIDQYVDEEISIGDYVLMGGEVAAQVIIESVSRMKQGVVGNVDSVVTDSFFYDHQFGIPQYTQPRDFRGMKVPEILLSGHHKEIENWRKNNQKRRKNESSS